MHLLYYDEVKYDPPEQKSFWLGGICIHHADVAAVESEINKVSEAAFGSPLLSKETEFHGIEICRGNGLFRGKKIEERTGVLKSLLDIAGSEKIIRVKIKINPDNIKYSSKSPEEIGFMYLIEQAEKLFREHESIGMLFGDYDEPAIGKSVASLSQFRKGGTNWARGQDIENIIDTVHFAKSHHSRLIQLADVFLYCLQFNEQENTAPWRAAFQEVISGSKILECQRAREWPLEPYWYR